MRHKINAESKQQSIKLLIRAFSYIFEGDPDNKQIKEYYRSFAIFVSDS